MLYSDNYLVQRETLVLFKAAGMVLAFGQWKACHTLKKFDRFFSENGHS